jgi:hypothetical protein
VEISKEKATSTKKDSSAEETLVEETSTEEGLFGGEFGREGRFGGGHHGGGERHR